MTILALHLEPTACVCPFSSIRLKESRKNPFTKQQEVTDEQIKLEKQIIAKFMITWTYITEEEFKLPSEISLSILSLLNYLAPGGNAES